MQDQTEFFRKLKNDHPELCHMQINQLICHMVDYLHQKKQINMEDFVEFLESRALAEKMARQPEPFPDPNQWIPTNSHYPPLKIKPKQPKGRVKIKL